MGSDTPGMFSIATAGNDFVFVWSREGAVLYRIAGGTLYSMPANVDALSRPCVECSSSSHCIVAYATRSGDIHGFTFDPAQPYSPQLFVAAASERDEREPELLLLSDSRGLIAYRSGGSDERLATRTLKFGPARRRSVR
jgi:hypothetical protein